MDIISNYAKEKGIENLALENLDFYEDDPTQNYRSPYHWVADPEFINEIFDEHKKIKFLLDIGHAMIYAINKEGAKPSNIKEKTIDYISQLPIEKIKEIHVAGITWDPEKGIIIDSHKDLTEWEYLEILGEVLDHREVDPKFLVYEPRIISKEDLGWFRKDYNALIKFLTGYI